MFGDTVNDVPSPCLRYAIFVAHSYTPTPVATRRIQFLRTLTRSANRSNTDRRLRMFRRGQRIQKNAAFYFLQNL